jgi:hypothetical protein
MNLGGFSWRRFLGISALKARISRRTGIPLSRSGRQQKIGRFCYRVMKLLIVIVLIYALWKWLL